MIKVQIKKNNKYIKNSDSSNSEIKKEVKSIKLSGYTNILIGLVGIICSIVALLCGGITKIIIGAAMIFQKPGNNKNTFYCKLF